MDRKITNFEMVIDYFFNTEVSSVICYDAKFGENDPKQKLRRSVLALSEFSSS